MKPKNSHTADDRRAIKKHYLVLIFIALFFADPIHAMKKVIPDPKITPLEKPLSHLPQSNSDTFADATKIRYNSPKNDATNTYNPVNNNLITISFLGLNISQLLNLGFYQKTGEKIISGIKAIKEMLMNHKKEATLGIIGTLYIMLNARLFYLQKKLDALNHWSNWRSDLGIPELSAIPRQTLYNDLLLSIQTRYTNFKNFHDTLAPLSSFLEDTEEEEYYIKHYRSMAQILQALPFRNLTLYNHRLYKQLDKKLKRLLFLKDIFLNWHAERALSASEKRVLCKRFPMIKKMLSPGIEKDANNVIDSDSLLAEESTEFILENITLLPMNLDQFLYHREI